MSKAEEPVPVSQWPKRFGLPTAADIRGMSKAISALRQQDPRAEVGSALFVPSIDTCLPARNADRPEDMRRLAAQVLVASSQNPALDVGSIRGTNPWVSAQDIGVFLEALGIPDVQEPAAPEDFALPGRPALEAFFREYVIEPSADRARYEVLRVQLPNGILLYGPPGSGKTHAVDTLVAALRRPVFRLDLGAIGSPFIHQTTVQMRKAFEQAKQSAPSLLILEEIDAVAPARGPMSHDHKVEELTEILRMIESASKNGVLVLATTNRRDALDPAILRKGRFDHSVHVDYPTRAEVELALRGMLKDRPHNLSDLTAPSEACRAADERRCLGVERGGPTYGTCQTRLDRGSRSRTGSAPIAGERAPSALKKSLSPVMLERSAPTLTTMSGLRVTGADRERAGIDVTVVDVPAFVAGFRITSAGELGYQALNRAPRQPHK